MKRSCGAGTDIGVSWCIGLFLGWACGFAGAREAAPQPQDALRVNYESGLPRAQAPGFHPTDIIVKFAPDIPAGDCDRIAAEQGCRIIRSCEQAGLHLVRVPEGASPPSVVEGFLQHQDVEYAELDYYATVAFVPDDAFFSYQWNFVNEVTGGIHMEEAWNLTRGDPNVIVAILDTGIAYEDYHEYRQAPDLAQTRFVPGYDFVHGDDHPNDDHGHGTHVAGTIAQSTDNLLGVAGVAFRCSLMPVKVMDEQGVGDSFTITQGIQYAVALEFGIARNLATDDAVDGVGLAVFARHWLATGALSPPGDLNGDHRVDLHDFAALAGRWGR